jgi:hypothetical protein
MSEKLRVDVLPRFGKRLLAHRGALPTRKIMESLNFDRQTFLHEIQQAQNYFCESHLSVSCKRTRFRFESPDCRRIIELMPCRKHAFRRQSLLCHDIAPLH